MLKLSQALSGLCSKMYCLPLLHFLQRLHNYSSEWFLPLRPLLITIFLVCSPPPLHYSIIRYY